MSSQYYLDNRDKILAKNKLWRVNNKEKIRENKRLYEAQPERRVKKREKSAREYLLNRDKVLLRQANRRRERQAFLNEICLRYGCQNPDCKWQGIFEPYQLTFHHFDPSKKVIEVAKMESWSYGKIVEEVNKCVVLCRNCHPMADKGDITINEFMICKVEEAK